MTFRRKLLLASGAMLALAGLAPHQAQAGLIGVGGTVQAFYYNGVFASPEGELNAATNTSVAASLATVPVNYLQGAADGSTIAVNDTSIVITNVLSGLPFCTANLTGTACTDVIDGFDFLFTGENILGVTADASSAALFLPVSGTFHSQTHLGLQLISNNEIRVDVTGDEPLLDDQLILDLSFTPGGGGGGGGTNVPEPTSLVLLGSALLGLAGVRRTRKAGAS